MLQWILSLPIWGLIRVFGIASFLLLFFGVSLGIIYSFPFWKSKNKAKLFKWHTFCTNSGTLLGLLHAVFLIIDTYMPFTWREILIPFTAKESPFLNGIGTIAVYGTLLLIFTSDIRNKLKKKIWHGIHLLAYPIFFLALIHGLFLGSDSGNILIRYMYFISLSTVLLLTLVRSMVQPNNKKEISRSKF